MELNDSYAQTRGQILMMEPLLPIFQKFLHLWFKRSNNRISIMDPHFLGILYFWVIPIQLHQMLLLVVFLLKGSKIVINVSIVVFKDIQLTSATSVIATLPGYKPQSKNSMSQAQAHQSTFIISRDTTTASSGVTLGALSSNQCQQLIALLSS